MTPAHDGLARAAELFTLAARREDLGLSARALCLKAATDLRPTTVRSELSATSKYVDEELGGDALIEAALRELGRLPLVQFRSRPIRAAARAGRQALRVHG